MFNEKQIEKLKKQITKAFLDTYEPFDFDSVDYVKLAAELSNYTYKPKKIGKELKHEPRLPLTLRGTKPNKSYGKRNWLDKAVKDLKVDKSKL